MSERTSDEIRREIERKRQEMDRTVDELERRLTPAQMLDHALWMLRGSETGTERARAVADGVVDFAKRHPIPVALMSAGAAWLVAESRRRDDVGPGTYAPAEGRVGPYMGDALDRGPLRGDGDAYGTTAYGGMSGDGAAGGESVVDRARSATGGLTDRVADATGGLKDRVADVTGGVGDRVHDAGDALRGRVASVGAGARDRLDAVREGTRERVYAAGESVRSTADAARERSAELAWRAREEAALRARQARMRYDATLDENPLALGAAAFGLGLAAGLAVPPTRIENDLMGAKADALKGEARSIATDAARAARAAGGEALSVARREALPENIVDEVKGRVQRVASNAVTAARETARTEGLSVDSLKERARRVASEAVSAAKETARAEGLSADALKERAAEAGDRVRGDAV